ncbi:hypothetical protein BB560_003389 [Smittium megazygosporum]|uniref:Importin N-terminal domain-containing protein n=1 Tax=Smittium megazygosporum TaxID=133381 RepID=A0A2T9ZC39_9FUNG|nr:hypothetical protein BB560_003389 [Smittium megazygosporum]
MLDPNVLPTLRATQLEILQKLITGDYTLTKQAENEMGQIANIEGYHYIWQDIYLDKSLPDNIRMVSAINFKNGIKRHWKRPTVGAIKHHEKVAISNRLLELYCSNTKHINIFYNDAIATVVKSDFPRFWPSAFNDIVESIERIRSSKDIDSCVYREDNMIQVLHLSIKDICSIALPLQRQHFREFAIFFLPKLYSWISECSDMLFNRQIVNESIIGRLANYTKITKRALCFGLKNSEKNEFADKLFENMVVSIEQLLQIYHNTLDPTIKNSLLKYILSIQDLFLELAKINFPAFLFMNFSKHLLLWLGNFLISVEFQNFFIACRSPSSKDGNIDFCLIYLKALLLFSSTVKNLSLHSTAFDSEADQIYSQHIAELKSFVFSDDFVNNLVSVLVSRYMALTELDLVERSESPETWVNIEELDLEELEVRPCAERVYYLLLTEYSNLIIPSLLTSLQNIESLSLIEKDSLYNAIGQSTLEISKSISFSELFDNFLIKDLQSQIPQSEILRHRVVWLIGKWTHSGLIDERRSQVYQALTACISTSEPSLVVKLASVIAIKECINDWNFDEDMFSKHCHTLIVSLIALYQDPSIDRSKSFILSCLSSFVERMKVLILPFLDLFSEFVPWLWSQLPEWSQANAGLHSEPILIITMMNLSINLINASGEKNTLFHPIAKKIIEFSCDPDSPYQLSFFDSGTELWSSIIRQSTDLNEYLLFLFPLISRILKQGATEFTREHFKLVESYSLIGIQRYFVENPETLLLNSTLNNSSVLPAQGLTAISLNDLLDSLTECFSFVERFEEYFIPFIKTIGVLVGTTHHILGVNGVFLIINHRGFINAIYSTIANSTEYASNLKGHLAVVFSRLCIIFHQDLNGFFNHISQVTAVDPDLVHQTCIDFLIENYILLNPTNHKSTVALALSYFLSCTLQNTVSKLPFIISRVWYDYVLSIPRPDTEDSQFDQSNIGYNDGYESDEYVLLPDSQETIRKTEFLKIDSFNPTFVVESIKESIEFAKSRLGQEEFQAKVLSKIDKYTSSTLFEKLQKI